MSEEIYDTDIAPVLLELVEKCKAHGMTIVASVEWEKGESGSTVGGDIDKAGTAQVMTALAARSGGNIDGFLMNCIKRFNVEQSIFLHSYNKLPANGDAP